MHINKGLTWGMLALSLAGNVFLGRFYVRGKPPARVAVAMPDPAFFEAERGQYRDCPPAPGGVVFTGDSTAYFPLTHLARRRQEGSLPGPWGDLIGSGRIVNRAIWGDTIHGVHVRVGDVAALAPAKVFIQVGTNDLASTRTPEQLAAEYADAVAELPDSAKVYAVGSLPTGREEDNARLRVLNGHVRRLTAGRATYVDLWPQMSAGGRLNPAYTFDGTHLNRDGVDAWAAALLPYVLE